MTRFSGLFTALFLTSFVFAQQQNMPLNYEWNQRAEHFLAEDAYFHTAVKPFNQRQLLNALRDSLNELGLPDTGRTGFRFGLSSGDMLSVRTKKPFYFSVNPVLDLQAGYDIDAKELRYTTGYGAQFNADLGPKVSLSFTYQGVREKFLSPILGYAAQYGVLTGYRKATAKGDGYASQLFSGYLSFTPNQYVNLQVGNDKQFWGDGYRTFLLGDNASNYPYFRMTLDIWRIKYVYMLNVMRYGEADGFSVDNNPDHFETKFGSYHYLSVAVTKWMQFGFFEGVTWYRADSGRTRGLELNYLNPIAFIRPVEFALGSPDNVIMGINLKFKPSPKNSIYLQVVLDDMDVAKARGGRGFYRTKIASQVGFKSYDLFRVKHLDLLTEFNLVRPYVFAHKEPAQNYTNYNQSLVHPLGANFYESMTIISWWHKHWAASAKFQYARQGLDAADEHNGSNIFISDFLIGPNLNVAYGNKFLQGIPTNLYNLEMRGGYVINPKINLTAEAVINYRKQKNELFSNSYTYFGFALRTNIFNRYTDF